ncbi:MAG TPA: hypothetical protein VEJ37_10815, partial [Xanthobacteraceae bacterium]|nr:hypothetical protein [Xanthobacteraceae bacterium]
SSLIIRVGKRPGRTRPFFLSRNAPRVPYLSGRPLRAGDTKAIGLVAILPLKRRNPLIYQGGNNGSGPAAGLLLGKA